MNSIVKCKKRKKSFKDGPEKEEKITDWIKRRSRIKKSSLKCSYKKQD